MIRWVIILMALFSSTLALGVTPADSPECQDWIDFINALGGLGNLGTLGVVGVLVQGVMLLLRTKVGDLAGKYKILIVTGLSLVMGVVGLMQGGLGLVAALMHSTTLSAFQVFLHQLYKQVIKDRL